LGRLKVRTALKLIYNPGGFMTRFNALFRRLFREETGGEVLEYALIAGLIVVAAIAVIGTVGTKVLARWTSLDSSI
jgi:pilus assembly protein Flp/PilA